MSRALPKFWAVVPAAGIGKRFSPGIPKQFHHLNGHSVAEHSLSRLLNLPMISTIFTPCDIRSPYWSRVPAVNSGRVQLITGGDNRARSVLNGLDAIEEFADQDDWVLVHDMARPCVMLQNINQLITHLAGHPVGGVLAVPVDDTLKKVSGEQHILGTVDRSQYWLAQTPQMFRFGRLKNAVQAMLKSGQIPTDEASAIEYAGHRPQMVEGRRDNIKITKREDLAVASAIMKNQELEACV